MHDTLRETMQSESKIAEKVPNLEKLKFTVFLYCETMFYIA